MSEPLTVEHLVKRYGKNARVLDGLTHTFAPGTVTALVGPNGAGKTTLLRLLSTQAYPTSGTVAYGDLDVHAHPHAYLKHVGVVHATDDVLPAYLSAVEVLEWILRARERWDEDAPRHIARLLDRLGLDERREQLVGTYSSGMVGKTQLAAALVHASDVLLLDEPFRSLDAATTEAAAELLSEQRARGVVIILSGHDAVLLDMLADETLRLGAREAPVMLEDGETKFSPDESGGSRR